MCNGGDFPPEFMDTTEPRARKPHRCGECDLTIPAGVVYRRTAGKWDGHFDVYLQHAECHELLNWISDNLCGGEPWTFESLREELGEYGPGLYGDDDPAKPLTVEAHARMAAIEAKYAKALP